MGPHLPTSHSHCPHWKCTGRVYWMWWSFPAPESRALTTLLELSQLLFQSAPSCTPVIQYFCNTDCYRVSHLFFLNFPTRLVPDRSRPLSFPSPCIHSIRNVPYRLSSREFLSRFSFSTLSFSLCSSFSPLFSSWQWLLRRSVPIHSTAPRRSLEWPTASRESVSPLEVEAAKKLSDPVLDYCFPNENLKTTF